MSSQEILGLKNVVKKINLDSVALVISEIESFFFLWTENFIDKPKETEANQQLHQKRVQN